MQIVDALDEDGMLRYWGALVCITQEGSITDTFVVQASRTAPSSA